MGPPLMYLFIYLFYFLYCTNYNRIMKKKKKLSIDLFVLRINLMDPKELSFTPNCKMNIVGFKPTIG